MTTTTTTGEPATDPRAVLAPLLFGFFPTQVLHVGASLGVADLLVDGPRTSAALAHATDCDEPSLYRVLRALACFGVLDEVEPGTFAHGPHAGGLVTGSPTSMRHLIELFAGHDVWRSWGELAVTVRTGEPAWDRVTGMSAFEHMASHPDEQAMFNQAMSEGTRNAIPGIIEAGEFDRFSHVVDVGGGDGTLLVAVLAAHPGLRGTVFDTETGLVGAAARLAGAGLTDRAATVAGDFFTSVPGDADAYLVKSVIHDWDDARATAILANIAAAMPSQGTLLVIEPVMPAVPAGSRDVLMMVMSDLNMLVCTGGKERTEDEFRTVLTGAGFDVRSITPAHGPTNFSVIEAVPAPRA
ncbi:MAG TPA: methyltransferase [Acidimicrobiales bacterium]|nr:methyltransferase [Acidimicrobiales bacterium]